MEEQQEIFPIKDKVYYKNLPIWPEFDIYDKHVDGLIPSSRLESWEQFHDLVKCYRSGEEGSEYVFRGQHNYKWALQPTLDRMSPGAIHKDIARKQLRNFRLSIRGRVPDNGILNEHEEELWAIGQHHGLATPLLDWTLAPYVALFFAFINEDLGTWKDDTGNPTNHSRAIYILNKSFIEDLIDEELNPLEKGYPKVVEPSKDDHGRLVNQAGLFTIAPYGETIESALLKALVASEIDVDNPNELSKYICKIHIPNSHQFRRDCLQHLRKMNIHYASIFPDLIGASGYCNELIKEVIDSHKTSIKPSKEEPLGAVTVSPPIVKTYTISESDETLKELMSALIIDTTIKKKVPEKDLKLVAKMAIDFIENKAGIDWFIRESETSRLRNIIRRNLKKIQFPDDFIALAADTITSKAATMSSEKEKQNGSE